ncbi:hypothetical protein L208DRAFT_1262058 [Tricholoma matsutake]|nr:hypothetical protein L208DRAFT_1262058 [Tricholoma matsutake 945]
MGTTKYVHRIYILLKQGYALANMYKKDSHAMCISLKWQFYGFHHDTSRLITEYILAITDLVTCLKAIKIALLDINITNILIYNLDDSWGNIAPSLTAAIGELKLSDVTGILLDEEGRQSHSIPKDTAPAA